VYLRITVEPEASIAASCARIEKLRIA